MSPRAKILVLIFGLVLPYFALVMNFIIRDPQNPFPTWFPYSGASYMLGTILLVTFASRKISRAAPQPDSTKSQAAPWWARAGAMYLVTVWSGGFLWGAYKTFKGDLLWERAVPAGAFLLAFISLFSWLLYADSKQRSSDPASNSLHSPDSHPKY
jgi:hypothetical protein